MKFKKFFKSLQKSKSEAKTYFYGVGGLIYRVNAGCFEILLSQKKENLWDIPKFALSKTDKPETTLCQELRNLSPSSNFKIIQLLHSPDITDARLVDHDESLYLFLIRAVGGHLLNQNSKPIFAWLDFKEASRFISDDHLRQKLNLIREQIKKAQI